ncbi:glucose-6-phosphate dehydrogenase [Sphingobium sp. CECT 9361]|uniref:glucose-6-phosphate dehydrogenase n=1 Tax=Sphingobium sp. CECT 9361 TaxID=2845384 RepID=UPI001E3B7992|nr:glucose-6-phosphate dehydrogenase [Sphingobium sp. CECT 9361]CAH0350378.1 Glucose-6-phosphate 1-dehydrogenase [Sphingobium sp. CECT 9361]
MSNAPAAPPATFVIFGARGDLTRRLLVPALVNLVRAGLLADDMTLLGISHHDGDDEHLRQALDDFVEDDAAWRKLRDRIRYLKGDFADTATYQALGTQLTGNAVFYLATAPNFFGTVVDQLGEAGLLNETNGFRRIVIEKPFGTDLASAHALNSRILARASEDQIYRIDHFLGKETVQNIMVARFGNTMIEAVWNNRYVDHVQITAAEAVTVGTRGKFYDGTGALRDMVPNHLFQLLAMIGMEPPISFDAEAIRIEKGKVIAAIRPIDPAEAIRGRYAAGSVAGVAVPAYLAEPDVDPASRTETFAALKVHVETWRWSGVPFYLRTGKAMPTRDTEIVVQFRDVPLALFRETVVDRLPPNRLVMQIQPDEGISLEFVVKRPGPVVNTAPVTMDFRYKDHFEVGHQTGYETLLYDVLTGDQTLFQRAGEIEGGWRAVQPLLDVWAQGTPEEYAAGSAGPESADALMHRSHRRWHRLG